MIEQAVINRIKETMFAHLKTKGYPDMDRDSILAEVPAMWDKLIDAGFGKEFEKHSFTFDNFRAIALQRKLDFDTLEEVAKFFRRGP